MEKTKNILRIGLLQADIPAADYSENRARYDRLIDETENQPDLWILPETFATGFCVDDPESAENHPGDTLDWMLHAARRTGAALTGSAFVRKSDGRHFNRMYFALPNGEYRYYDKAHVFSYGGEGRYVSKGSEREIWEYKGWRIRPAVCYDIRFPVWTRNEDNYDLLVCVANWPSVRITAWDVLTRARAIENLCYLAACNRVGTDKNGTIYDGHSVVYTPTGRLLASAEEGRESVVRAELSLERVRSFREKYGFLADRDPFTIP